MARMPELSLRLTSARLKPSSEFDFFLRQNTFGAAFGGLDELAVVDHGGPMRRHGLGVALGLRGRDLDRRLLLGVERYAPLGGESVLVDLVFRCHCFTVTLCA